MHNQPLKLLFPLKSQSLSWSLQISLQDLIIYMLKRYSLQIEIQMTYMLLLVL